MSTNAKNWFTAKEIGMLGEQLVAGLPKTESGSRRFVNQSGWAFRETKGAGGPGGKLREYQPPGPIQALIDQYLVTNPDFFGPNKPLKKPAPARTPRHIVEEPTAIYGTPAVNDAAFEQQVGWSKALIKLTLLVRNLPQFIKAPDDLHQRVALLAYRFAYLYSNADLQRINLLLGDNERIADLIHKAYEADCMQRGIAPGSDLKNIPWYQIGRKLSGDRH